MARDSVSKLVSSGANGAKKVVNTVAKGTSKVVGSVAKGTSNVVGNVAKGSSDVVTGVAKSGSKVITSTAKTGSNIVTGVTGVATKTITKPVKTINTLGSTVSTGFSKVESLCDPNNIIPCLTALVLIAYIVIVNPTTVLDMFSTKLGKALSMLVVLISLLFDVKLGVMLGLAVILSISLSSVNKDLYESYNGGILENYTAHSKTDMLEDEEDPEMEVEEDTVLPDLPDLESVVDPTDLPKKGFKCTRYEKDHDEVKEDFTSLFDSDPSEPFDITGIDTATCKFAPFLSS